MNPFKWLWNDLKNDWTTLKGLVTTEEYRFDPSRVATPKVFALFIILAFLCGVFVSAKYYEKVSNDVIAYACQDDFPKDCPIESIKEYSVLAKCDDVDIATQLDTMQLRQETLPPSNVQDEVD